jgi:cell division septation protein DedD
MALTALFLGVVPLLSSPVPEIAAAAEARGLRLSGDRAFVKEDYKKAAEFYEQASRLDRSSSVYRHLHALSAAHNGQTGVAMEIWNDIAEDLSDEFCSAAALHLAYLEMQKSNWVSAYSILQASAPADTASPLYVPFVWEMLECSRQLGRSERVSFHEKQLSVIEGSILEESGSNSFSPGSTVKRQDVPKADMSFQSPVTGSQKNNEQTPAPTPVINKNSNTAPAADANSDKDVNLTTKNSDPKKQKTIFTIQVGAFGSKENAENLVKKLSVSYSDVTIMSPNIGGPVLYRVRVGAFESREEAELVAKKLSETGMSPRVMER